VRIRRLKEPVQFELYLLTTVCLLLAAWMLYLMVALPSTYRAQHWDAAWIIYDGAMLASLLITTWAIWRRRLLSIPAAMISATFLGIDSWFDVSTAQMGTDLAFALTTAVLIEIPLAVFLALFSHRAIKRELRRQHPDADDDTHFSLWNTQLLLDDLPDPLPSE
jgi:hypothetical protein